MAVPRTARYAGGVALNAYLLEGILSVPLRTRWRLVRRPKPPKGVRNRKSRTYVRLLSSGQTATLSFHLDAGCELFASECKLPCCDCWKGVASAHTYLRAGTEARAAQSSTPAAP